MSFLNGISRQEARQKEKKEKRHMPEFLFESLQCVWEPRCSISSWMCLRRFCKLANIGTLIGVPVGTNWKTNLFLWGTKTVLRLIPVVANTQWKHMHHFRKCKPKFKSHHIQTHHQHSATNFITAICGDKMLYVSEITQCSVTSTFQKQGKEGNELWHLHESSWFSHL